MNLMYSVIIVSMFTARKTRDSRLACVNCTLSRAEHVRVRLTERDSQTETADSDSAERALTLRPLYVDVYRMGASRTDR